MGKRSIVYIDGFNLYYGAVRGTQHRWLDIQRFFEMVRKDDDLVKIRYFTARVTGDAGRRQAVYLRALLTLPLVEIIEGKFKRRDRRCSVAECTTSGSRIFQSQEEKRTDVNIAVSLLDDAYQRLADRFVIVSGDSDLVPAISMLRLRFPDVETIVYVPSRDPQRGAATELRFAAHRHRTLPNDLLPRSQLAPQVRNQSGEVILKPDSW